MIAGTPAQETKRIAKIREYENAIDNTETSFNNVVELLSSRYDAFYAGIHFIDQDKQRIKASTVADLSDMDIDDSICYHTLQEDCPLMISDLREDPRTKDLSYVNQPPYMRSYYGIPLRTPDSCKIGTVCVMDREPRQFEDDGLQNLHKVAETIIEKFEVHRKANKYEEESRRHADQLKEIHHRLKNNLNLISGFIDLERMRIDDQTTSDMLERLQKRVKSIATLHQRLYQGESLQDVEIRAYLEEIMDNVCRAIAEQQISIDCRATGNQITLSEQKAVYVGLLVNELLTNTIKHAFEDCDVGSIRLDIRRKDQQCHLRYRDDGCGLPEDFDLKQPNSLGTKLIGTFINQLEGDIDFGNDDGAYFRITFPING